MSYRRHSAAKPERLDKSSRRDPNTLPLFSVNEPLAVMMNGIENEHKGLGVSAIADDGGNNLPLDRAVISAFGRT